MSSQEKRKSVFLGLLAAVILAAGVGCLFINGPLGEVLRWNNNIQMLAEVGAVFVWMLLSFCAAKTKRSGIWMALTGIFLFSWCHQAFLPLLVSGTYSLLLLVLGKMGTSFLGVWKDVPLFHPSSLIMGSGLWMLLVCVISAFGTGGMDLWRGLAVVLALGAVLWMYAQKKKGKNLLRFPALEEKGQWDKTEGLMLAMILTCILIQAGRMNVALDYDSLHYGLRSPYILDNGRGIYENLGSVNVVYTYSKGLEVLALPLSGLPGYGFVLAFTIWQTVGVLIMGYRLAAAIGGRKRGLFAACVMALTPGILNMSVTAKSDIPTLLFQLAAIEGLLFMVRSKDRKEQAGHLFMTAGACLISFTLKPTSLVFSTAAVGSGLLCLMAMKIPVFRLLTKGIGFFRFLLIPGADCGPGPISLRECRLLRYLPASGSFWAFRCAGPLPLVRFPMKEFPWGCWAVFSIWQTGWSECFLPLWEKTWIM